MTIAEYIESNQNKNVTINGITCVLFAVNYYESADINEKVPFEGDVIEQLSFLDRLKLAQDEIKEDTDGMTCEEANMYYQQNVSRDNQYYWGGMVWVSPNFTDNKLYYGVRMD